LNRLLESAHATHALGAALAKTCPRAHPGGLLLFLSGELGAGKTTLAQGFLRELGVQGTVRSPTYTLIEPYETTHGTVLHADFYRLTTGDDAATEELREQLGAGCVCLLEWPEHAAPQLRAPDLLLRLTMLDEGRRAECSALTPSGREWLRAAAANPSRLVGGE
jgi:tRNA threonylcarbamoyladenosine biosynthesis protein TsaE